MHTCLQLQLDTMCCSIKEVGGMGCSRGSRGDAWRVQQMLQGLA